MAAADSCIKMCGHLVALDWPDTVILINILINSNHLREFKEDFNNMGQIIIIIIIH